MGKLDHPYFRYRAILADLLDDRPSRLPPIRRGIFIIHPPGAGKRGRPWSLKRERKRAGRVPAGRPGRPRKWQPWELSFLVWNVAWMIERTGMAPEGALRVLWRGQLVAGFYDVVSFEMMRTLFKSGKKDPRTAKIVSEAYLLECSDEIRVKERNFARDMHAKIAAGADPTEKQAAWLRSIYHRLLFQGGRS